MRRLIIPLLFTLPSFSHATPLSQSETQDLVRRIQAVNESRPSIQANFHEERHTAILKEPVTNEGKIWATFPDKIRREIDGNRPSAIVIDGQKMVCYYPNLKKEEMYDLEKRPMLRDSLRALTAGLNFRQVNSFYNIEASKYGSAYAIAMSPKTAGISKVVKWVTLTVDQNLLPSRVELETARGEKVAIRYSDVRHKSIPESMFRFTPPPGTKVTQPAQSGRRML